MKILIVEDDFTSATILQKILGTYGDCDLVTNGKKAITAFLSALNDGRPYDLICLDIMMPEMDGQETLKEIRIIEKDRNILGLSGVKVIMTTALDDRQNVIEAFRSQCDGFIAKPIKREILLKELKSMDLLLT